MVGCPPVSWKRFAPDFLREQAPIRHVRCRSGAVGKVNGRHLSVLRYARGSHHHLLCLVDALALSLRPACGRSCPRFDSFAALLGRLFLRPVLVIVTIVLIEPRKQ